MTQTSTTKESAPEASPAKVTRRTLDRTRDFGEVHGVSGCRYVQDFIPFDAGGNEISQDQIKHYDDEPPQPSERDDTPIHVAFEMPEAPATVKTAENTVLENLEWKKLKAMVESFGGTWTDRESAIAYLKGAGAS